MAKRYFKKVLSMGLALAMCASLAVPAFAASFTDLNNAIDGNGDTDENKFTADGAEYYGYGKNEENGSWDIWAWNDGDIRNVELHGNVEYEERDGTQSDAKIDEGQEVVLDLNGQEVNNSAYVASETAKNTGAYNSSVIHVCGGELTVKDSSGNDTGKITGAQQSGVWVESNGKFTLKGGSITENKNVNGGSSAGGGGVRVNGGEFTMAGGKITNNSANANGGGVAVVNGGKFTMEGGEISGNHSDWGGGVAVIGSGSSFTMKGTAKLENNELYNENGSWGNNIPSDVYVKEGATVDASGMANFEFKFQGKGMAGADSWNDVEDTATNRNSTDSEAVLRSVYTTPTTPDTNDGTEAGEPEIEIDDPAVPLAAGPITRAEFIDYLWRHENGPEGADCTFTDVAEDHDYVLALGWAEANEVAVAYDDSTFKPDELVTVAAVREFLGNFANVFGTNAVDVEALTTLTGGDGEAVLNCAQVLAEFFGEEYVVPNTDGLEIDDAA